MAASSLLSLFAKTTTGLDITKNARILGTIYGNCCGDAIGLLIEFMEKEEAKEEYGDAVKRGLEYSDKIPDGHRLRWKNGDWTDDSDQMIIIMNSITRNRGTVDHKDIAKGFVEWAFHGFKELGDHVGMGVGTTTDKVLRNRSYLDDPYSIARGVWEHSGKNVAANGCVMRTSILGVHNYNDLDKVVQQTLDICLLTHADPRCQAAAVAVTTTIAMILQAHERHLTSNKRELNLDKIISDSYDCAVKLVSDKDHKKQLKKHMFATAVKDLKLAEKGKIGYSLKCMGSGFWAIRQNDFRKALTELIMEGGDADTNGAVAGAMLGCKLGFDAIPESWVAGMPHKDWLKGHVDNFLALGGDTSEPVST